MQEHCVTCRHWNQEDQSKRPASLRTMFNGKCPIKGETKRDETCWCWKQADREELERRGYNVEAAQLN